MLSQDDLFKIVGLLFLVCLALYIGLKLISFQGNIIEGLTTTSTDKENIVDAIKININKLSDSLLINKYRKSYEDIVINLKDAIDLSIVSEVINNSENISRDVTSDKSIKSIEHINKLKLLLDSLNETMEIIDKK